MLIFRVKSFQFCISPLKTQQPVLPYYTYHVDVYNLGSTLLCKKGISMKTILSGISQQSHDQEKKSHSYVAKNHVIQGLWL